MSGAGIALGRTGWMGSASDLQSTLLLGGMSFGAAMLLDIGTRAASPTAATTDRADASPP